MVIGLPAPRSPIDLHDAPQDQLHGPSVLVLRIQQKEPHAVAGISLGRGLEGGEDVSCAFLQVTEGLLRGGRSTPGSLEM